MWSFNEDPSDVIMASDELMLKELERRDGIYSFIFHELESQPAISPLRTIISPPQTAVVPSANLTDIDSDDDLIQQHLDELLCTSPDLVSGIMATTNGSATSVVGSKPLSHLMTASESSYLNPSILATLILSTLTSSEQQSRRALSPTSRPKTPPAPASSPDPQALLPSEKASPSVFLNDPLWSASSSTVLQHTSAIKPLQTVVQHTSDIRPLSTVLQHTSALKAPEIDELIPTLPDNDKLRRRSLQFSPSEFLRSPSPVSQSTPSMRPLSPLLQCSETLGPLSPLLQPVKIFSVPTSVVHHTGEMKSHLEVEQNISALKPEKLESTLTQLDVTEASCSWQGSIPSSVVDHAGEMKSHLTMEQNVSALNSEKLKSTLTQPDGSGTEASYSWHASVPTSVVHHSGDKKNSTTVEPNISALKSEKLKGTLAQLDGSGIETSCSWQTSVPTSVVHHGRKMKSPSTVEQKISAVKPTKTAVPPKKSKRTLTQLDDSGTEAACSWQGQKGVNSSWKPKTVLPPISTLKPSLAQVTYATPAETSTAPTTKTSTKTTTATTLSYAMKHPRSTVTWGNGYCHEPIPAHTSRPIAVTSAASPMHHQCCSTMPRSPPPPHRPPTYHRNQTQTANGGVAFNRESYGPSLFNFHVTHRLQTPPLGAGEPLVRNRVHHLKETAEYKNYFKTRGFLNRRANGFCVSAFLKVPDLRALFPHDPDVHAPFNEATAELLKQTVRNGGSYTASA